MPLAVGDALGPYEIMDTIGAGGMGEVWKARDTRLDRTVAIKISRAHFSERFAREARAIAALNHPNICQLYDVGPDYLVMEYVEGSTLKGPLAEKKATEYAQQILSALDAAHRRGIIHCDLKPANILVTKQHGIKLLDFGLARIKSESADLTLTQPGYKMGTPAYMAPEQWDGRPSDARTDIYCFGCVLYEMLTGRRALQHGYVPLESPSLESVVRTCMEDEPEERWQSAADIRRALSLLQTQEPATESRFRPWHWIALAGSLAVLAAAIVLVSFWFNRVPPARNVVSFALSPPPKTVFTTPRNTALGVAQFALSPDGRTLAFVAGPEGERPIMWLRPIDETSPRPLPGTEDAEEPFWSPDSRWIGFFAEGGLKKVPASGGPVQTIVSVIKSVRGGSWGADDTILFANATGPVQSITASGGQPAPVTTLGAQETSHRYPFFLPDGRHFLYLARSNDGPSSLYAGSVDDESKKQLAKLNNSAVYSPLGFLLFANGDTLFGQRFDGTRLELKGQSVPIIEDAGESSTFRSAVSTAGETIAYTRTVVPNSQLTWYARNGHALVTTGPEGYYTDFRLSPNDKSLAVSLLNRKTGRTEIWINDLERGSNDRIAVWDAGFSTPIWSPDSTQLIYRMSQGSVQLDRRSAAGGGSEQMILSREAQRAAGIQSNTLVATDWAPDGKAVLCSEQGANNGSDLWLLPLTGNRKPLKLLASASDEMHGNFSPNGRLFAYSSNESGRFQVYVQTFPLSNQKWHISTDGGYEPRWRADGRELFYLSTSHKLMAVPVYPGPSFGMPKALFETNVPTGVIAGRLHFVPSRDGQRFLINTTSANQPTPTISVVTNWAARLRR